MKRTDIPPHPGTTILSDRLVWQGRFPLQLVEFTHARFDGATSGTRTWELWRRGQAAAVLPYDPIRDQVVLIEQYRLPALAAGMNPVLVELAAGLADGTESPEDVARREAVEELGLGVDRLERIGAFLLTPGGCDETCTLFAGRVHLPSDGHVGQGGLAEEHEDIRVFAVPAAEAIENALAGRYPNSVCALGLMWLAARRDWLRARWA